MDYDVIVIGGGTAGSNAASAAIKAGAANVALIRNRDMSNTCVIEGCMPSKAILAAASRGLPFAEALLHGKKVSERLERSLNGSLEEKSFDVIWGRVTFSGKNELQVTTENGGRTFRAKRFVIATGASSFIPPIEGLRKLALPRCFTSDDVAGLHASLSRMPEELLILGAGPIGLEMATFFSRLGTEVTILEMGDSILPALDPEFGEERLRIAEQGKTFRILTNTKLVSVKAIEGGVEVTTTTPTGETLVTAGAILVATGRKPNLDDLGLARAGLSVEEGTIPHNRETLQTNNPDIYIAGDVTGHHQILHMAAAMGQVAGINAATPTPTKKMDYDAIAMSVVFEEYPSASVGLTELEARERGIQIASSSYELEAVGRGITDMLTWGIMKLVVDKESGRVLGAQMLGPYAGEVVQVVSPILALRGTVHDMINMTFYHPTFAELLRSLAGKLCDEEATLCPGAGRA